MGRADWAAIPRLEGENARCRPPVSSCFFNYGHRTVATQHRILVANPAKPLWLSRTEKSHQTMSVNNKRVFYVKYLGAMRFMAEHSCGRGPDVRPPTRLRERKVPRRFRRRSCPPAHGLSESVRAARDELARTFPTFDSGPLLRAGRRIS